MKKLYTLFAICCLSLSALAQVTVTVNATGTTGSYKTGYINNLTTPTRNDNGISVKWLNGAATSTTGVRRGWAVFDLAGLLPGGATVTAASIRFTVTSVVNTNTPSGSINGYAGDMSTITAPNTVYNNCAIAGNEVNTTAWPATTGTYTRAFNAFGTSLLSTYSGSASTMVSFGFNSTSNQNQIYTITGYSGTAATQPQLSLTYVCNGLTSVSASATPNPVCIGSTISLTSTVVGTAAAYSWSGPGGFTSTDPNPSFTATGTSAGIYSVTATNSGGCPVKATVAVTTNPSPTPITGNTTPCLGTTSALASTPTTGGIWTINGSGGGATISGSGVVNTGTSAATYTVSYTLPSGCRSTTTFTTLDTPTAIALPPHICGGTPLTLSSTPAGGSWTVNPSSVASIDFTSGTITGLSNGTANITYTGANGCATRNATPIIMPPASTITSSTGSLHLCPTLSFTLANAITGGTWSTSGSSISLNSTSGVATGLSVGLSPVTYTNTCGSATGTVSVDPPPPPITGVFSTCVNATVLLSNTETGGVWSSSDTAKARATAGWGTVTGVSAGSATITYTAVSGCTVTTPFTVNPIPAPITGLHATCIGTSTTLFDASPNGVWSSADTFIAKVDTAGRVRGLIATNTTITYTFPATGCYITAPFTVNPLPVAISGNNTFCTLKSDTLSNLSLGGTWSSSNSGIAAIAPNGVVTGVSGGSAIITYTLPTGCYRTRPVIILPLPNAVITYNGAANTFSTGTFYTSYQWYFGGLPIAGATSYNVAALANGSYNVYVTDTNGCEKMSSTYNLVAVGVNDVNVADAIKIQPNPSNGFIKITAPVAVHAIITSIEGKKVMEQSNATDMDISALANGMYMIQLYDNTGRKVAVEKLIKQ